MKCDVCGNELDNNGHCSYCESDGRVRVMSENESAGYSGVTVDENGQENKAEDQKTVYTNSTGSGYGYRSYGDSSGRPRMKVYTIGGSSWMTKLVLAGVVAVVLAILAFVLFPLALLVGGAVVVGWLLFSFFFS